MGTDVYYIVMSGPLRVRAGRSLVMPLPLVDSSRRCFIAGLTSGYEYRFTHFDTFCVSASRAEPNSHVVMQLGVLDLSLGHTQCVKMCVRGCQTFHGSTDARSRLVRVKRMRH